VNRRRSWLAPLLVLLLVVVPIFEVWLLIQVGQQIGVWPTVLILVLEALLGAWLMRREGARAWTALNTSFATGRMPTTELTDGALVLVGGVLLMLPGFATDVIGFLCLLPFTRPLARRFLAWLVVRRIEQLGGPLVSQLNRDSVIEGETVEGPVQPGRTGRSDPTVISGEIEDPRR
jgi:UPF0716 protein FxsA